MNQIIPMHRGSFRNETEAALHLIDACSGPCQQGRNLCPCPDSCVIPGQRLPMSSFTRWVISKGSWEWADLVIAAMFVGFCGALIFGLLP